MFPASQQKLANYSVLAATLYHRAALFRPLEQRLSDQHDAMDSIMLRSIPLTLVLL